MRIYSLPLFAHIELVFRASCLSLLMLLVGCSNDDFSDLTQYILEIKAKPKGKIKPLPEVKIIEPFIFRPEDLRDPFEPLKPAEVDESVAVNSKTSSLKPDTTRRKDELEAFPLENLKMVGTVNIKTTLWALIALKSGQDKTVYRVRVGHHMGQNYGKIIRVDTDKVELMEMVQEKPGIWHEQPISITMDENSKAKK